MHLKELVKLYKKNNFFWKSHVFLRSLLMTKALSSIMDFFPKQGVFVELGCGTGMITNYLTLAVPNLKLIGVDLDKKKLDVAKKTILGRANIEFLEKDVTQDILACDGILMSDFLHHLPYASHKICMETAFNALRDNGVLLIVEADPNSRSVWRYRLGCLLEILLYPFSERANYVDPDTLASMLSDIGFSVDVKREDMFFPRAIYICHKNKKDNRGDNLVS